MADQATHELLEARIRAAVPAPDDLVGDRVLVQVDHLELLGLRPRGDEYRPLA
jgi:hypothetical protein